MLYFRPLFFYFKVGHLSGGLFHGFGSLQRLQGILSWIQFVDPEIMKCDGATTRTICRVGSYVSPVSNKLWICSMKVERAPEIVLFVLKTCCCPMRFPACLPCSNLASAERIACFAQSGTSTGQRLSICVEKPRGAPLFRACALKKYRRGRVADACAPALAR